MDHWGDATRQDNVKFRAGARGCPKAKPAFTIVSTNCPAHGTRTVSRGLGM
jgi:hypothetical protein